MAAALEWITSQALAASAGDPGRVWSVCEEATGCVQSGLLRRGHPGGSGGGAAVEGLLAWVLEAGQDKAVPLARVAAFRLLAGGVIQDCPVRCRWVVVLRLPSWRFITDPDVTDTQASILGSASFEKFCQLLRSGTSAAATAPCRQLACEVSE